VIQLERMCVMIKKLYIVVGSSLLFIAITSFASGAEFQVGRDSLENKNAGMKQSRKIPPVEQLQGEIEAVKEEAVARDKRLQEAIHRIILQQDEIQRHQHYLDRQILMLSLYSMFRPFTSKEGKKPSEEFSPLSSERKGDSLLGDKVKDAETVTPRLSSLDYQVKGDLLSEADKKAIIDLKKKEIQYIKQAAFSYFEERNFVAAKELFEEAFKRGSDTELEYTLSLLNTSNEADWQKGAEILCKLALSQDRRTLSILSSLNLQEEVMNYLAKMQIKEAVIFIIETRKAEDESSRSPWHF
jgi:hypothetical protein